jgi:hypothetical protein
MLAAAVSQPAAAIPPAETPFDAVEASAGAVEAPEPSSAPVVAEVEAPASDLVTERFVALSRIFAGRFGDFDPGDTLPAQVAEDGLTEGVHFERVKD